MPQRPDQVSPRPGLKVIHFQDLHTNYEAQKNSSKLIEHLYKTYGIDLILSEGAFGNIGPSKIKVLIKDRIILDLASKLLMKTGELTGEEYIAVNRDYPIRVFGIEDKALYWKNREQFNNVIKYSNDAQVFLNQIEETIKALKPKVYNKETLFNDKKLELNDYLDYLTKEAKALNLDIQSSYPNLNLLQKSLILEKTLNTQKTQEELKLYLTTLTQSLSSRVKAQGSKSWKN